MNPPTPSEALDHLDKAAATVSSNREGHDILKQAVEILRKLIREHQP